MNKDWMKLDNAAKVYPLVESDYNPNVFRFSATIDRVINREFLLNALNRVILRFPYYKVTLKKGIFWYYLEDNHNQLHVYEDMHMPCRRIISEETNGYLFRVLYKENVISVEFNHIIADGTAGLIFLNTIVYEYLKLEGLELSLNEWIKDINSPIDDHEYDDSHSINAKKYLKTHDQKVEQEKGVFHIKDRLIPRNKYILTIGVMDSKRVSEVAKQYNCSITVLLTAVYLESMAEIQKEQIQKKRKRKSVAIQVPVNMRKRLNSVSMRNFSLFITPYLRPNQEISFENMIDYVNVFFEEKTDINKLLNHMVLNYKTAKSIGLLPLPIKSILTPFVYKVVGADTFSGTISNIGKIKLPESMEQHISRIDFILGPCPESKSKCSVVGYKDQLIITFGRTIPLARLERKFFQKLVQLGINVHIESQGDTI